MESKPPGRYDNSPLSSKIVFLSQNDDLDVVRAALGTAQCYVYKTDFGRDFLPAIQAVLRGQPFVSSTLKGHEFTDIAGQKAPHRHEVLFYSDDTVLLDSLARFIATALKAANGGIGLATKAHRQGYWASRISPSTRRKAAAS